MLMPTGNAIQLQVIDNQRVPDSIREAGAAGSHRGARQTGESQFGRRRRPGNERSEESTATTDARSATRRTERRSRESIRLL